MTETGGSLYPDDWIVVARKDWHRTAVLLEDGDPDGAAFFLQQSLEKYLKAFLLGKGWKLRKIHELDTLLDYAVEFGADLEEFRELCERVRILLHRKISDDCAVGVDYRGYKKGQDRS